MPALTNYSNRKALDLLTDEILDSLNQQRENEKLFDSLLGEESSIVLSPKGKELKEKAFANRPKIYIRL